MKFKYHILLSGTDKVFYTFWRQSIPTKGEIIGSFESMLFIQNLSTDKDEAIKKATDLIGRGPDSICEMESIPAPDANTLRFGKHKGQTLADLAETDRNYLKWMVEKFDTKRSATWLREELDMWKGILWAEKVDENRAKSTSRAIAKTGTRLVMDLTVYAVKTVTPKNGDWPYNVVYLNDIQGNKFLSYSFDTLEKHFGEISEGKKIKVKATIKSISERAGIIFNMINRPVAVK